MRRGEELTYHPNILTTYDKSVRHAVYVTPYVRVHAQSQLSPLCHQQQHKFPLCHNLYHCTISGQGPSSSSPLSAALTLGSSTASSASPTRTVYREAGQNASLACGGVNANTLVRKLEWLCRGCRSASPSHETTIASFKGGLGSIASFGNCKMAIFLLGYCIVCYVLETKQKLSNTL